MMHHIVVSKGTRPTNRFPENPSLRHAFLLLSVFLCRKYEKFAERGGKGSFVTFLPINRAFLTKEAEFIPSSRVYFVV